jgi:hypothetical protein
MVFAGFDSESFVFDSPASGYDVWFEQEGRSRFASEVEAMRQVLPLLYKPWVEIGEVVLGLVLRESPWAELRQTRKDFLRAPAS